MYDELLRIQLLQGNDVMFDGIKIKNHKLDYIFNKIKYEEYNRLISLCVIGVKDIVNVEDISALKDITLFDLICNIDDVNKWFVDFLDTFTDSKWIFSSGSQQFVTSFDEDRMTIDESNIDGLFDIVKKIYCVGDNTKKDELDINMAVDKETAELVKEFNDFKKKSKPHNVKITINSIIETLSSCSHKYDIWNIFDLTMYQLIRIYYRFSFERDSRFFMQGIYAGTIDSEKIKLEEYNIAKEIDV